MSGAEMQVWRAEKQALRMKQARRTNELNARMVSGG